MGGIIEVQHLKKYFNTSSGTLHAVDDVSFEIQEGETLGVVGESGCGKSTLGRVILHLLDSTEGKILFRGEDITHVDRKKMSELRKSMQIIFQDPFASLNPRMTIYQTIREPMDIVGGYSKEEIEKRVYELMDTVGLARRLVNTYPHELDGGRRQRVGIARALVLNPKFIVCDEPVSALDVSIQAQILNLLMDLQDEHKLTYMFVTHNLFVVKHISHNIMVMYMGQVVEYADKEELFAHPTHPYTKALLAAIPQPDLSNRGKERELLKGEVSSPIEPKPGCRFAPRCPYASEKCREGAIPLKEIAPNHLCACTLF